MNKSFTYRLIEVRSNFASMPKWDVWLKYQETHSVGRAKYRCVARNVSGNRYQIHQEYFNKLDADQSVVTVIGTPSDVVGETIAGGLTGGMSGALVGTKNPFKIAKSTIKYGKIGLKSKPKEAIRGKGFIGGTKALWRNAGKTKLARGFRGASHGFMKGMAAPGTRGVIGAALGIAAGAYGGYKLAKKLKGDTSMKARPINPGDVKVLPAGSPEPTN